MGDSGNNTLIKSFLAVILGTIMFGLLFDMLTGGGDYMMDMMSMMGGNSGSMNSMNSMNNMNAMNNMSSMNGMGGSMSMSMDAGNNLFGSLIGLLVNFLMIVLVVALIAGVIVWIKNNFFKDTNFGAIKTLGNDPVIKTVTVGTIAILGIILVLSFLNSFTRTGMGFNYNMSLGMGYNPAMSIVGLLTILIHVLSLVLVISLILAVVAYLKKQYDSGVFNFNTKTQPAGQASTTIINTTATEVDTTDTENK